MGVQKGLKRIGRFFTSLTNRVYRAVAASPVGRLFSAYSKADAYFQNTAVVRILRPKPNKTNSKTARRMVASAMDQSFLRRAVYGALNGLCRCSLRVIGVFFVVAAIYSVAISWLITVLWQQGRPDGFHAFFSLAILLFGVLLMFSKNSVGYALRKGRLTGGFLHRVLDLSAEDLKQIPAQGVERYALAVPLGMLTGTVVALTGPLYPALTLLLASLALLILTTPEAGILLLLLFAPFSGFLPYATLWLALGASLCGFGYLFKLMRGTRAFHMEIQDLIVLLVLLLTLLSGVSAAGGSMLLSVCLSALLILVYFPAVNVLATPNWLKRCRWGVLVSATAAALIAILQFLIKLLEMRFRMTLPMDALGSFVHAGFSSNIAFSYFMVMVFPFALHAFLRATSAAHRILAGFSCMAILTATILCWAQSAWLALLIEIVILLLLCKRASFIYVLGAILLIPITLIALPSPMRAAFFSFMSGNVSVSGTGIAAQLFFGDGVGFFGRGSGISRMLFGLGAGGVERIGVLYWPDQTFPLGSGISFWWARWFESGILGVILPAVLFFFLLQNCFSLLSHESYCQSAVAPASGIAMAFGFLLISAFNDVGGDPATQLLFFLLLSVISADARYRRRALTLSGDKMQTPNHVEVEYRIKEGHRKKKVPGKEISADEQQ